MRGDPERELGTAGGDGAEAEIAALGPDAAPLDALLRKKVDVHLNGFERRARAPGQLRHAAVALVLLDDHADRACFLITRRASKLSTHAGQWALPGGSLDAGESCEEAALRELHEEVGLALPDSSVLGLLDDYPTRSGFLITPVVLWGGEGCRTEANPAEVAKIYRVPLGVLDAPDVPILYEIPESDRPVIAIPMLGSKINAPTAAVIYQFREVAVHGRLDVRVDHYEQPTWAWK